MVLSLTGGSTLPCTHCDSRRSARLAEAAEAHPITGDQPAIGLAKRLIRLSQLLQSGATAQTGRGGTPLIVIDLIGPNPLEITQQLRQFKIGEIPGDTTQIGS